MLSAYSGTLSRDVGWVFSASILLSKHQILVCADALILLCPPGLWDGCGCHGEWHSGHHDFLLLRGPQLWSGHDCRWANTRAEMRQWDVETRVLSPSLFNFCQAPAVTCVTWRRWGPWNWWKARRAACVWTQSGGHSGTMESWRTSDWSTTGWWTRRRLTPDISCKSGRLSRCASLARCIFHPSVAFVMLTLTWRAHAVAERHVVFFWGHLTMARALMRQWRARVSD